MTEPTLREPRTATGRKVVAMMSTNHIDPDLAAELFVLDAPPDLELLSSETTPEAAAP